MFKRYDIYAEHYDADDTVLVQTSHPDVYVQIPSKKSFGELTNTSHINKNHDEEEST